MRLCALLVRAISQIASAIGIPKISKRTSVIFFYLTRKNADFVETGSRL